MNKSSLSERHARLFSERTVHILLVEDNPGDVDLFSKMMDESKINNVVKVIDSGQDAVDYILGKGHYADENLPDLIFLNLRLPDMDGLEVLNHIKSREETKCIPVVIFTGSLDDADVARAYHLQANSYIVKPINLDQYIDVLGIVADFWLRVVKIPGKC